MGPPLVCCLIDKSYFGGRQPQTPWGYSQARVKVVYFMIIQNYTSENGSHGAIDEDGRKNSEDG
jgi:hypothetical protein